jgi:hypothetical protein
MPDTITELEKLPLNVVESLLKYCKMLQML